MAKKQRTIFVFLAVVIVFSLGPLFSPAHAVNNAFVLSYFGGADGKEALHLAYSYDGLNWTALNNNNAVLEATIGTKRVRDPFIYRKPDGKFVVISTQGWDTDSIYLWDSNDLLTYTNERLVRVNTFSGRAWAPECVYDSANSRSVIFWSAFPSGGGYNRIYCNTTTDFVNFSAPQEFFNPGYDCIDGTIEQYNGVNYLFFKDEQTTGAHPKMIMGAKSTTLNPGSFGNIYGPISPTNKQAEGPACIKSLTQNKWYLYYDFFNDGGVWGCSSNTDISNTAGWTVMSSGFSLPGGVRHGNGLEVNQAELDGLLAKWGPPPTPPPSSSFSDDFNDGNANGWTTYDGTWAVESGQYSVNAGLGYKSVANGTNFSNFTCELDVMVSAASVDANAGLIFRVTNPSVGPDAFNGYYAGIDDNQDKVRLGRMNGGWTEITSAAVTINPNTLYHMKVVTSGSNIKVYVGDMTTPKININDATHAAGAIGVRSHQTHSHFDNVSAVAVGATVTPTPTPAATATSTPTPTPTPAATATPTPTPGFSDDFNDGNANGWTTYGGTWAVESGQYSVSAGEGYKSVANGTNFGNFTYEADVMVSTDTSFANGGVLFRVANPAVGVDAYQGYFAGINAYNDQVELGRANNNWTQLGTASMTLVAGTMYHLKVVVSGSNIKVYVGDMVTPKIDRNDTTFTTGMIGVRTYKTHSHFDNVVVR